MNRKPWIGVLISIIGTVVFWTLIVSLFTSCQYEELDKVTPIDDNTKPKLDDYSKSWDIIRNYPKELLNYKDLGYYSTCQFDTTAVIADFNLDGYNDVMLAPQCSDDDQRQPPIKIFYYTDGEYIGKTVTNTGPMAGARTTIIGDYNGDKKPDVFFIAHNGHGYDFGVPSILLSDGDNFTFKDLDLERKWYSDGTSGDIDNDGDLDIIFGGNTQGLLLNDGYGNFTLVKDFIDNFNSMAGLASLTDFNADGYLDLIYRDFDNHRLIYNNYGTFDYNSSIELPMPMYSMQTEMNGDPIKIDLDIKDRLIVDYDKDGDLDIITVSIPHNPVAGYFNYLQVLRNDLNGIFTDVSDIVLNKTKYMYYVEWLRAKDLDKDGNIEIFEHQKTNNWFNLEFNGTKFISN